MDDGTAECVLHFDQEVAKLLLNISDNEYNKLKSKSYHYGVLEHYRESKVKVYLLRGQIIIRILQFLVSWFIIPYNLILVIF